MRVILVALFGTACGLNQQSNINSLDAASTTRLEETVVVYTDSTVDVPPQRISGPRLRYPEELRKYGCQGGVELSFIILPTGAVFEPSITVLRSADPEFSEAAIAVVAGTRFTPGMHQGQPVHTRVTMTISFAVSVIPHRSLFRLQCRWKNSIQRVS